MRLFQIITYLRGKLIMLLILLLPAFSFPQGLVNNGANIIINGSGSTTANVFININGATGNYLSTGAGAIRCANIANDINADGSGTSSITVGGNWTNNSSTTGITGSGLTTIFNNATALQTVSGTSSTTFYNLICQGFGTKFTAPSSSYALQVGQNFSINGPVSYSNISSIQIGKLVMGNTFINSGNIPVTIGDDYINTTTGTVTGDYTYNGSAPSGATTVTTLLIGALNYNNLNILSADGTTKIAPVNGATTIAGVLTVADKCTTQANANLTLLSTVNATASVAALTGTANITGNVNVQRFVTGSYGRGYRLISSPINTSTGFYTIAQLINFTPVTGPNPGTGSYDASNTNNASVWVYREGDPFPANTVIKDSDYKGVYSLAENIPVGTGLLFFNRGSRTNLNTKLRGPVFPTPDDYAYAFTGTLNQGNVTVNVPQNNINNFTVNSPYAMESPGSTTPSAYYYRYNSAYPPVANLPRTNWYGTSNKPGDQGSDGFNLIGNPYAATIDLDKVTFGADLDNKVYMFNPSNKQFSYYTKGSATSGSAVTDGNGANRYIASGQGFFVRNNVIVNSTNAGVSFAETNKVNQQLTASTSPLLLMSARSKGGLDLDQNIMGTPVNSGINSTSSVQASLMLQLQTDSVNYDGVGIFFNKNWLASYDKEDAADMDGMTPSVYLSSYSADNRRLAINKMPAVNESMRIKLFVDATSTANQQLKITDMSNIAPKYNVYVVDHYKKDSLLLTTNNAYNLNINRADTNSLGANRLELVFKLNAAGAYKLLNFTGKIVSRSVVLDWTTKNEANYTSFIIEKSTDGGKTFVAIAAITSNSSGSYSYTDNHVDNANSVYRLKQTVLENGSSYSDNVKINFNILSALTFYVYPNPAFSYITVNSTQSFKGLGEIRITNMNGSLVLKATVSSSNAIRVEVNQLRPGIYVVELTDAAKKVIGQTKFIKL